jgi:GAF domain-containing protein
MQVGRNSVGRPEHFQMVVVYGLKPNDSIFTITDSARCYPAFATLLGPLAWPLVNAARFLDKCMNLATELERLADALESEAGDQPQISFVSVAERIAKALSVRTEEVAILGVSHRWQHLHFVVPEALKNVGFIPLSSKTALAARTTRESRPEIINDFTSVRHATVFEGVKLAAESAEIIQKIISAPILSGDRVVGVIQISRKGANVKTAGPDFTSDDLGKVLSLCKPLGKLLQRAVAE